MRDYPICDDDGTEYRTFFLPSDTLLADLSKETNKDKYSGSIEDIQWLYYLDKVQYGNEWGDQICTKDVNKLLFGLQNVIQRKTWMTIAVQN